MSRDSYAAELKQISEDIADLLKARALIVSVIHLLPTSKYLAVIEPLDRIISEKDAEAVCVEDAMKLAEALRLPSGHSARLKL